MSSLKSNMDTLKGISTEIKRLDDRKKELKRQAAEVQKEIVDYLQKNNQKGVKTKDSQGNDTAFILHTAQKTINKPASDKTKDSLEILRANGVADPEKVLKQLEDGRKGIKVPVSKLKIMKG